ncbi:MAG: aspartate--tRNA ligase [Clostridia bacterium]|nr:aspartate--tRNA ligase [Clostridia bacterium]
MDEFKKEDKRTDYCGTLSMKDVGRHVVVCGWTQKQRNLGTLIFADLRDRTGIVQLAFDETQAKEPFDKAYGVRSEDVLCAKGVVRERSNKNKNIPTGDVEIVVDELKILGKAETPPFMIDDAVNVNSELRLKYRFLDLRRPSMQKNILARSAITKMARDYFAENGFIDIETPTLIKPTPEGARDYLVPSRIHHGKFYALPQSPQLYKQILMYSGFDRYIQIARCYRDEDLRADRQPEFTQIDMEVSFTDEEELMTINEGFMKYVFKNFFGKELKTPFPRLTWKECMERFGSDKPDMRFGFELTDLTEILKNTEFKMFADAIAMGGSVRAINVKGGATFSRKDIDALTEKAKQYKAKGVAWLKRVDGGISSSFAKFLTEAEVDAILGKMQFEDGDLLLLVADKNKVVFDSLGALRCECAKKLGLLKKDDFNFLWVTEFPLFEYSEEDGRYYAMHHPFTAPMDEDYPMIESDPGKVRARAYDIVLNGTELGGGSVRIHTTEMQQKMFNVLGISKESADEKFGFLLEAFKYGVPPHAGLAYGLDRLVCLLLGLDDIREVIAFPKVQNASELMSKCPSFASPDDLKELGIAVVDTEKDE